MRRLLHFITRFLRVRIITNNKKPLFERYKVFLTKKAAGCYLHHYLRSDPDRGPHNHPWDWAIAIPLVGGYIEERLDGFTVLGMRIKRVWRRPFVPYFLFARDYHRIIIAGQTSWSLFIHGPRTKSWGFLRQDKKANIRFHEADPPPKRRGQWPNKFSEAKRGKETRRAAP